MNVVTRKLIAKELYVNRWLMAGGTLAGLASILLITAGNSTAFNIGALAWLTTIIALGVIVALYGVMNERKEHTLEFVLSLPLSTRDYVRAKLVGLAACFGLPWLVLSLAALLVVAGDADLADGLLPYTILLCGFLLANYSVVLCSVLHVRREALTTAVIIVTNMGVSVFMFTVGAMPSLRTHMFGPVPVWNATFWTVLAVELAVLLLALTLPLLFAARRRDFL